jgi:hypothetical protein
LAAGQDKGGGSGDDLKQAGPELDLWQGRHPANAARNAG